MFEWDQHGQMQEGAGTVGGSHPSGHDDPLQKRCKKGQAQRENKTKSNQGMVVRCKKEEAQ